MANDAWESRAVEDGQIVFEEVEGDADTPILRRLAAWCEQQTKRVVKPLVKAAFVAALAGCTSRRDDRLNPPKDR